MHSVLNVFRNRIKNTTPPTKLFMIKFERFAPLILGWCSTMTLANTINVLSLVCLASNDDRCILVRRKCSNMFKQRQTNHKEKECRLAHDVKSERATRAHWPHWRRKWDFFLLNIIKHTCACVYLLCGAVWKRSSKRIWIFSMTNTSASMEFYWNWQAFLWTRPLGDIEHPIEYTYRYILILCIHESYDFPFFSIRRIE